MTSTIRERVTEWQLRMTVKLGVPESAQRDEQDEEWKRRATGWTCTLRVDGRSLVVPFWMGPGHGGKRPRPEDVLDCLLSDATGELDDFDAWCAEYGYDTDSRKAYRMWEACRKTRTDLVALLGSEETFDLFAYHTERL